jgi:hypothetical protein
VLHDLITSRRMLNPNPGNWRRVVVLLVLFLLALAAIALLRD